MPKRSPWILDPPPKDLDIGWRGDLQKPMLIHVFVPRTLWGQVQELAAQLTQERGERVSLSDVVRGGLRTAIKSHLKGAK
jgi:hypothetical protein